MPVTMCELGDVLNFIQKYTESRRGMDVDLTLCEARNPLAVDISTVILSTVQSRL